MASNAIGRLFRGVRVGDKHSIWNRPELQAQTETVIESPSFADGGVIGEWHSVKGVGENLSPGLRFSEVPAGTAQLLLVIEDTDVPLPRPIIHTIALLEPDLTTIEEGGLHIATAGVTFVPASFGQSGYAGPRPLPGHGPHTYGFCVFWMLRCAAPVAAADHTISEKYSPRPMAVLARGRLRGIQERG